MKKPIKVIIAGTVLVKNLPENLKESIQFDLLYDNPAYINAKKYGKFINPNTDPYIYLFSERGSSLMVPRGYLNRLLHTLSGRKIEIIDKTITTAFKELEFTGNLREYQFDAVVKIIKKRYGILEAGTGAGKTVCGIATATQRKLKTLVIVHNKELLYQWKERIQQFTNVQHVGLLGDGIYDIQPFTVGIINSVSSRLDEIKNTFGYVILDECHRTIGSNWIKAINYLKPHAHLGLSATPYRSDGLTAALFRQVGPLLHKVDRKHLERTGAIQVPEVVRVTTKYTYPGERPGENYSRVLSDLAKNPIRNEQITSIISDDFKKYMEPIMVVSDRVSHCEEIIEILKERYPYIKPALLIGKTPKDERKKIIKGLRDGTYNTLIATISLLGEGFDAPNLSSLFLCTPIKFSGRIMQVIGRVLRPSDNRPRVYDFRDNRVEVLLWSGTARDRLYNEYGWG